MDVILNLPKKDMKASTVYLLYDTSASNIKLQNEEVHDNDKDNNTWEYVDKDKFTIMYNPDDIRKSTEIKILSKTKLRSRPKSADFMTKQDKGPLRGIVIKRSNSLSTIDEIFLMRRSPLIKPLLSETEIMRLQNFQKECRMKRKEFIDKSKKEDGEDIDKLIKDSFPSKFGDDIGLIWTEDEKTKKMRDTDSPALESKGIKRKTSPDQESNIERKTKKPDKEPKEKPVTKQKTPKSPKTSKTGKNVDLPPKSKKPAPGRDKKERLTSAATEKAPGKTKNEKPVSSVPLKEKTKTSKSDTKSLVGSKKSSIKTEKSKSEKISIKSEIETSKSKEKSTRDKSKQKDYSNDKDETSKKSSKQKIKSEPTSQENVSKHLARKDSSKHSVSKSDKSKSGALGESSGSKKSLKEKKKSHDDDEDLKSHTKSPKDKSKKSAVSITKEGRDSGISKGSSKKVKEESDNKKAVKFVKEGMEKTSDQPKKVSKQHVVQYIIHYVLSNPIFIKMGWTLGPRDRDQVQVVTFKCYPANPQTYCFRERDQEEIKYYSRPTEKVAYNYATNGTGVIYYNSGVPAATITKHGTGMRLTLYSDPQNDPLILDSFNSKVLGVFDSHGNGVVYDMQGKKILNYNQLEGIHTCPIRHTTYKWQWCDYKILDRHRLKALLRFMAKDQKRTIPEKEKEKKVGTPKKTLPVDEKPKKSQSDEMYEQILAELPLPEPRKFKIKSENQFWGFKPITLKINDELTLRINGQDNIVINFSSSKIFHRIDLGVKVDPDIVERIELLDINKVTEVPCVFDGLLDLSPSLVQLNRKLSGQKE